MISQTYDLNLIPGGIPIRVPVSQYDSGSSRSLIFNLYYGEEGNGQKFTIPTGSTITIEGTKPDNKSFSYAVTYSGSSVTVPLHEQMAIVEGDVICQLTIAKNTQIIGTANFIIYVEPAPLKDGSDMSESEISEFRELAAQAQASASAAATSASQAATRLSELGTLSNLTTDAKTNLVAAINEADSHTDSNTTAIRQLNSKFAVAGDVASVQFGVTDTNLQIRFDCGAARGVYFFNIHRGTAQVSLMRTYNGQTTTIWTLT